MPIYRAWPIDPANPVRNSGVQRRAARRPRRLSARTAAQEQLDDRRCQFSRSEPCGRAPSQRRRPRVPPRRRAETRRRRRRLLLMRASRSSRRSRGGARRNHAVHPQQKPEGFACTALQNKAIKSEKVRKRTIRTFRSHKKNAICDNNTMMGASCAVGPFSASQITNELRGRRHSFEKPRFSTYQNRAYDLLVRLWGPERTNGARGSHHCTIIADGGFS